MKKGIEDQCDGLRMCDLDDPRDHIRLSITPLKGQFESSVWVKVKVKLLSHVRLFATPCSVAYHAPPSIEFSRQEYWSGLPFPSPGDLPEPGMEPGSSSLQADALPSEPPGKPVEHR